MVYTPEQVFGLWRDITLGLIDRGWTLSTMESCTSGLVASLVTDTEGASAVLKGAYVTYCNAAKVKNGVPAAVIEAHGVYSVETAEAMARACRASYGADIGVGVTGTLGRADPENPDSVSGEVFFAVSAGEKVYSRAVTLPPVHSRRAAKLQVAGEIGALLRDAVMRR